MIDKHRERTQGKERTDGGRRKKMKIRNKGLMKEGKKNRKKLNIRKTGETM